jgi:hypothetical protein
MIETTDWVARWLAIIAIVVGLVSPTITWRIWRRSGSKIRAKLRLDTPGHNRLEDRIKAEVQVMGTQAATIKKVILFQKKRTAVVQGQQQFEWVQLCEMKPEDGSSLPQAVEPTAYLTCSIEMQALGAIIGWDKTVQLCAYATRGDDKRVHSKLLSVKVPTAP